MPDEWSHHAAAHRNKELALTLLEQDEATWAAVVAFYSALHFVEAYLARQDIHPLSHSKRAFEIAQSEKLAPIFDRYEKLRTRSNWARYDLRLLTTAEVPNLIDSEFHVIEEHIQNLLSSW